VFRNCVSYLLHADVLSGLLIIQSWDSIVSIVSG
jgi:hypothetical protein